MAVRLRVDPIMCDGFGHCAELAPELVALDEWGYPILREPRPLSPAGRRIGARRGAPVPAQGALPRTRSNASTRTASPASSREALTWRPARPSRLAPHGLGRVALFSIMGSLIKKRRKRMRKKKHKKMLKATRWQRRRRQVGRLGDPAEPTRLRRARSVPVPASPGRVRARRGARRRPSTRARRARLGRATPASPRRTGRAAAGQHRRRSRQVAQASRQRRSAGSTRSAASVRSLRSWRPGPSSRSSSKAPVDARRVDPEGRDEQERTVRSKGRAARPARPPRAPAPARRRRQKGTSPPRRAARSSSSTPAQRSTAAGIGRAAAQAATERDPLGQAHRGAARRTAARARGDQVVAPARARSARARADRPSDRCHPPARTASSSTRSERDHLGDELVIAVGPPIPHLEAPGQLGREPGAERRSSAWPPPGGRSPRRRAPRPGRRGARRRREGGLVDHAGQRAAQHLAPLGEAARTMAKSSSSLDQRRVDRDGRSAARSRTSTDSTLRPGDEDRGRDLAHHRGPGRSRRRAPRPPRRPRRPDRPARRSPTSGWTMTRRRCDARDVVQDPQHQRRGHVVGQVGHAGPRSGPCRPQRRQVEPRGRPRGPHRLPAELGRGCAGPRPAPRRSRGPRTAAPRLGSARVRDPSPGRSRARGLRRRRRPGGRSSAVCWSQRRSSARTCASDETAACSSSSACRRRIGSPGDCDVHHSLAEVGDLRVEARGVMSTTWGSRQPRGRPPCTWSTRRWRC